MKREFLQLAQEYNAKRHCVGGWFLSEKLDGQRFFWDGGITRGMPKSEVPWANTTCDYRYRNVQIATGLWSRYGNVIHAPKWWLDLLPAIPFDGEGWSPKGRQWLMSVVKVQDGESVSAAWNDVYYCIFDMISLDTIFQDGIINNTNFKKSFRAITIPNRDKLLYDPKSLVFETVYNKLQTYISDVKSDLIRVHQQMQLPFQTPDAEAMIKEQLDIVTSKGGEGLIVRYPTGQWTPERSHNILKIKKLSDSEGIVRGYTFGTGKLTGLMGALILDIDGKRLELSGFTDAEREFGNIDAKDYASKHQCEEAPDYITNTQFPRGSVVTFRYRGLSVDGIPQEARYWRKA